MYKYDNWYYVLIICWINKIIIMNIYYKLMCDYYYIFFVLIYVYLCLNLKKNLY